MTNERHDENNATAAGPTTNRKRRKTSDKPLERRIRGGTHTLSVCVRKDAKTRRNSREQRPTGAAVLIALDDASVTRFDYADALAVASSKLGANHEATDDVIQIAALIWLKRARKGDYRTTGQCVRYAVRTYWQGKARRGKITKMEKLVQEEGAFGFGGSGRNLKGHSGIGVKLATAELSRPMQQLAKLLSSGADQWQCAQELGVQPRQVSRMVERLRTALAGDPFNVSSPDTIPHSEPRPIAPAGSEFKPVRLPYSLDRRTFAPKADMGRVVENIPMASPYSYDFILQFAHDYITNMSHVWGDGEGI